MSRTAKLFGLQLPVLWVLCKVLHVVYSCGGVWSTDQNWVLVIDEDSIRYTVCDYSGKSVEETPQDIRPDTQFLSLKHNHLNDINLNTSAIRMQVTGLLGLDLDYNEFTQLPDVDLFNASLSYLSLSRNRLTYVDFDYFSIFPNLRTLTLSYNDITHFTLSEPIMARYIYLQNNKIAVVNLNQFSILKSLKVLYIHENPVTDLIYPSRDGDLSLDTLVLADLPHVFHTVHIQNISGLATLNLSTNKFTLLDLSNYTNLPNLRRLVLNHNYFETIRSLPTGISLPTLTHLYLSACKFVGELNLTFLATEALPMLHYLELNHNEITSFSLEEEKSLGNLHHLRVVYNKIINLGLEFYITATPSLKVLNVRHNQMKQVIFPDNDTYHPSLLHLYLEENPVVSVSNHCLSYFSSHSFTIHLQNTSLQCDSCILWLLSCPYRVYTDSPLCASPKALHGKTMTSAKSAIIDAPCGRGTDISGSTSFVKKTAVVNMEPVLSIQTSRGDQECALKTKLARLSSFSYDEETLVCEMYTSDGGHFTVT